MTKPMFVSENLFSEIPQSQIQHGAHPDGDIQVSRDKFYLHGYSDVRGKRDIEVRRAIRKASGFDENGQWTLISHPNLPKPIPYRFQYVAVEGPGPRNAKVAEFRAMGYVPVKYDELSAYGIDPDQSTCEKGLDGTARVGSQMLMVCPADVAARNLSDERARTDALREGSMSKLEEDLARIAHDASVKHAAPLDKIMGRSTHVVSDEAK